MEEPSLFFNAPSSATDNSSELQLICVSPDGYTEIYRETRNGQFFCIKALKPEFRNDPIYEMLLRKEFEIGFELDHPNICRILRFTNIPVVGNCIEMQWIDGCTLQHLLDTDSLDKQAGKSIYVQILDALEYIHNRQIIHRDLKPSNILVTYNGYRVKLIDFGFSDTDHHSALKQAAGTLNYASPELLANDEVDIRSDIYSLGIILSQIKGFGRKITAKCTKRNREERYSNIAEIRRDIERTGYLKKVIGITLIALTATASILLAMNMGTLSKKAGKTRVFERVTERIDRVS